MSQESPSSPSNTLTPSTLSSTRKRPRSSLESFESMMCPVCQEYFVPPIVQCTKGHSVCYRCANTMVRVSGDDKCPLCRSYMMPGCRNYALEGQMHFITIGCNWEENGCPVRVTLFERLHHELFCEFRPVTVPCYFNHPRFDYQCSWRGNPMLLPAHLKTKHEFDVIERDRTVKFLWNPPKQDTFRSRYRVLKVKLPRHDKETSKFILEHVYFPEKQLAIFTVRTLEPEFAVPFSISIVDRHDSEHRLSFELKTVDFGNCGALVDYDQLDKSKVLAVPLDVLSAYCFQDPEDNNDIFFAMHVDFPSANKITND